MATSPAQDVDRIIQASEIVRPVITSPPHSPPERALGLLPSQTIPSAAASTRVFNRELDVLGHQRWADAIEAAAAYTARVHGWRNLHLYPGDDPSELIPRIPRAVLTWGVFLRHPHDDHGCGYEWDDTWRMFWAPSTEPGAIPITVLRHPAAPVAAADIPDPDEGAPATWAA